MRSCSRTRSRSPVLPTTRAAGGATVPAVSTSVATTERSRGLAAPRPRLRRRARQALTTIHVAGGVGLLGATASTLLLAVIATGSGDPAAAQETYRLISLQSAVFGIPLSMLSLLSGIALGLGTKWGVLRHWWTTLKLVLIVLVMANGALLIGGSVDDLRNGQPSPGAETRLLIGAALNVVMLMTATTLSMFKPGGRLRRRR
jgi:hypothetical protein